MRNRLMDDIHQTLVPRINSAVANGLAVNAVNGLGGRDGGGVMAYLDNVLKSAVAGLASIGITYGHPQKGVGLERCTPIEEYRFFVNKKRNNKTTYELARNDLYMVKIYFCYLGNLLPPVYLQLPYLRTAGLLTLRGSTFAVSPILTELGFCVDMNKVFVQLERDKFNFERCEHHYFVDGYLKTAYVIWANVHSDKARKDAPKNGYTNLVHYMLGRYGLVETFRRFLGIDIWLGNKRDFLSSEYPPEEWIVVHGGQNPHKRYRGTYYGSTLAVAYPRAQDVPMARIFLGGLFYVIDHFPEYLTLDQLTTEPDDDVKEALKRDPFDETDIQTPEKTLWRITLGRFIWGNAKASLGKIIEDVEAHYASIADYVDDVSQVSLKAGNIHVNDIYELFNEILKILSQQYPKTEEEVTSMYGKSLIVLREMMLDVRSSIYRCGYDLRNSARGDLTEKKVIEKLNKYIKFDRIMDITKSDHKEVNGVNVPGDNMFFKITSHVNSQNKPKGGKARKQFNLNDPAIRLHASVAEVGNHTVLPKTAPDGRGRLNPFVQLSPTFQVVRNPKFVDLLDDVQRRIRRR